jgi:hypothetical protein
VQISTTSPTSLAMETGATVSGRAMRDGQPLTNVLVGLVQQDRGENFTGPLTTKTDSTGYFAFYNVGPAGIWNAYVSMSSLDGKHSVPPEHLTLSLRIKGYHMSPANRSLNFWNDFLEGKLDRDVVGLKILLSPGERVMRPYSDADARLIEALPKQRIEGAVIENGAHPTTLPTGSS